MILLPDNSWEIRTTKSKGRGIFARKKIKPGTIVGDYVGKVINNVTDDTTEKDGLYLMYYHDRASIYPSDLQAVGIHLMNHSCMPNTWLSTYKGHTLFFALRTIFPGEELTADYLLSPESYCRDCQHQCICESSHCRGTMHLPPTHFQKWNSFHQKQTKETKRERIRYGKLLKPLKIYPEMIADNTIYSLFGTITHAPEKNLATILPTIPILRKRIRQTGKRQNFLHLGIMIQGIQNDKLLFKKLVA